LLLLDFFVWFIILYDVYMIRTLHVSVSQFASVRNVWSALSFYFLAIAVLTIYVPPLVSALVNFLCRDIRLFRETIPSRFRNVCFIIHFSTSLALAFFISISHQLELLSGFKASPSGSDPITLSSYEYSPLYSSLFLLLTSGAVIGLIGSIISALSNRKNLRKEFRLWFSLSDSSSEYFPKQKANLIFVNTASMAPTINWISTREESYRHTYQRKVPTSDDAKRYLTSAAERSRELLREYLFQDALARGAEFSIEFFPGTSRGFEVGLTQIEKLDTIIVSPYEHPSQNNVVEWFAGLNPSIKHKKLEMDYSILNKGWNEQKSWLISRIRSVIPANANGGKVAILISEVHYLTGMVINVTEIIEALRPDDRNSNLVFMVDGSQSVGNLIKPFNTLANKLHREDFYYFSAHKWLLSPNTCGVFIAEQNPNRYKIYPYDLFGAALPTATIDPGVIFGIRSSLQYLIGNKMFYLNRFHEKSRSLKSYFRENIGDEFEIIESASQEMNQSNFIAVRPRNSNRWRDNTVQEFWTQITRAGVDLTLVELDGAEANTWWLRISFPYFLQLHLLKRLIKHLRARVKSVN